ncbi:TadE family protein [Microbacterium saperdae]|uniref:TadE-like protein n=1 Tax=Microbacterium saperdae TaxID=69368 RepID=A0A543BKM2_9MICO|nr:TadE family protein [Microbacterium saperdae]TQL85387.1 hypothetical protein FB560_0995 [Microbacterium saperdae]GGM54650.1 hypothetical protein GCM10010489_27810 [Microbacterium saperdae]
MRRRRAWATNDDGSAALEFITVGVILLVPLVYLVILLGVIQEQTLGAEAAARHTARVIALASDADAVLDGIADEYGLDQDALQVSVTCVPAGVDCPSSGATVTVTIGARVTLPFVPAVFGLERALSIPVEASAVQKVSRLWGAQ